jgi:hypothetical protein
MITRIEGIQIGLVEILSNHGRSLREKIEDTKDNLHEQIVDTEKDLREELGIRIQRTQVEIDTTRTLVESMR